MAEETNRRGGSCLIIGDEYEYELISIKYSALTGSVRLLFWETSYVYKKARKKKDEPGVQPPELSIRKKKVKRKIKTSAEVLERLPADEDVLLCSNAERIIESIGKPKLYPVWYRVLLLERERDQRLGELRREIAEINARYDEESRPFREEAKRISSELLCVYAEAEMREIAYNAAREELDTFDRKRATLLGHVLVWKYSKKKHACIEERVAECRSGIDRVGIECAELEDSLHVNAQKISEIEQRRAIELCGAESRMEAYEREMNEKIGQIA